jgi:N-acetylmuramoyl-L-alanine amidase
MSKKLFFLVTFSFCVVVAKVDLFAQNKPQGNSKNKSKEIIVVIDAGHGGKDPGKESSSNKYKHEKDINLAIAKMLGKYLLLIDGLKVVYTRTDDEYVSLDDRVYIANKANADYFISIHCNSNPNKTIHGTRTFIHSHNFKTSRQLAMRIEKEFATRAGRHSRGIQSAYDRGENLFVLQYSEMPGVLIEVGFLTNPTEEKYLNTTAGQDVIASAIYRSFRDFISKKPVVAEDRSTVYRVQIAASTTPISLEHQDFERLGMRVEEEKIPDGKGFKYKYVVGREYDKKAAGKLVSKVRAMGYKDAFLIEIN